MALTVAIQMDPIEKIDIGGDSTFALALEAQSARPRLLYYGPRDLTFRDGQVTARARPLVGARSERRSFHAGRSRRRTICRQPMSC